MDHTAALIMASLTNELTDEDARRAVQVGISNTRGLSALATFLRSPVLPDADPDAVALAGVHVFTLDGAKDRAIYYEVVFR